MTKPNMNSYKTKNHNNNNNYYNKTTWQAGAELSQAQDS